MTKRVLFLRRSWRADVSGDRGCFSVRLIGYPAQAGGKKHHHRGWNKLENIFLSQSVRAQTNQNPRGIVLLFSPSLLEFEPSTSWRSFKEAVKVDAKNGLTPVLFRPIQYISTFTGRFELPRGSWSGNVILPQIANVCDLIQSRKLSGIRFVFIWG